ncbi:sigma-54 dependent transcriptional regulator [Isosphaeraceae bacterium EP7]
MPQSKIVIIGSDSRLAASIGCVVRSLGGLCVESIGTIDEALLATWADAAVVVIHLTEECQVGGAVALLRTVMAMGRPVPMILIAERPMSEKAYGLVRLGAVDALAQPVDTGRLGYLIETLTLRHRAPLGINGAGVVRPDPCIEEEPRLQPAPRAVSTSARVSRVPGSMAGESGEFDFITKSADMIRMVGQVRRVAAQDVTLLLGGETGTGKTRLARLVHDLSPRRSEPFLIVNCGALSSTLIETEMFGHVKGAFTGADRDRVGRFAEVGRGTLLLDEVDMLSPEIQAKLLRVVEDRVFEQVGSNRPTALRARLIAASNRPLIDEVAAGRFRSDLYFRLNVVGFELPPLRERIEGVLPIAERFAAEFSARNGRMPLAISAAASQALLDYDWPGNIRELRNVIERASVLCPGPEITPCDLPESLIRGIASRPGAEPAEPATVRPSEPNLARVKGEAELACITEALEKHGNNRLRAASELGISRMTLYKKLYKYGLMESPDDARRDPGVMA